MKIDFRGVKQTEPTQQGNFDINYAPGKRVAFRWRWYLMLVLAFSPIGFFVWQMVSEQVLVRAQGILTTEPLVLRSSQSSFVNKIFFAPGDFVDNDQIIIDLVSGITNSKIGFLGKELGTLLAYQQSFAETVKNVLDNEAAELSKTEGWQGDLVTEYKKFKGEGMIPLRDQLALGEAQRAEIIARTNLEMDRERAKGVYYTKDLADIIRNLELEIVLAEALQDQLNVRASTDGVINQIFVKKGEFVAEGDELVEMSYYTKPVIHVFLRPDKMRYTHVGQQATIYLPDGTKYRGEIREPVQIAKKIPPALAGPFEGQKNAIKVILHFETDPSYWIEGLPVNVQFDLSATQNADETHGRDDAVIGLLRWLGRKESQPEHARAAID